MNMFKMLFRSGILFKKLFFSFLLFLQCIFIQNIYAVQLPRVIGAEKRFRAYIYNPNDVYRYVGHYLSQSYIEFEKGETVQTISMGDTMSWQTVVLENKLFLKPVLDYANTNMTVMTNKRTYHFELDAVEAASVQEDDVLFYVKFMYPETEDKNIAIFNNTKNRSDMPDLRNLDAYNFNYEFGKLLAKYADFVVIVKKYNRKPIFNALMDSGFDRKNIIFVGKFSESMPYIDSLNSEYVVLIENDLPDNFN